MATEPIQGGPYPVPTDAPDGPNQMSAIVTWAAGRTVMRFDSTAARDVKIPTPTEGMEAFTGTGATAVKWLYFNAAWRDVTVRPATAYTPVLTAATTNPTNYTSTGRYVQVGKLVTYWFTISAAAAFTAGTGVYSISLPVVASLALTDTSGSARFYDSSTGNAHLGVRVALSVSTALGFQYTATFGGALGNVGASVPWVWAASDIIDGFIIYEAA